MFSRINRRKTFVACSVAALLAAGATLLPARSEAPAPPPRIAAEKASLVRGLPLHFEENRGQTDARVRYLARGAGYALFLTASEAVLSLRGADKQSSVVRMQLAGSNSAPEISGADELPGKVSYFLGRDSAQWRTNLPTFGRVRYSSVYPGVDLVYYGTGSQLEYDFIVAPGADPSAIAVRFDGADRLAVDADGQLVISTIGGTVRMRKPVVYQEANGARRDVAGAFELRDDKQVAFVVGDYDRAQALVIDPVLTYSTYLGGTEGDTAFGLAVDLSGNAYVAGETLSADFPSTGALDASYSANQDGFLTKLNAAGSAIVYSAFIGGASIEQLRGLAIDPAGNAYVSGITDSSDFPITAGAFDDTYNGNFDGFVTRVNASGSSLDYSTFIGGTGGDNAAAIAVDSTGNAYVAGTTSSSDFPATNGSFDTSHNGGDDAFVTKLNSTGTGLFYSGFLGGTGIDWGLGIAVDSVGNAYVGGQTSSTDFPVSASAYDSTYGGDSDAFAARISSSGGSIVFATYIGGTGIDEGHAIAIDPSSNVYVTGRTTSSDFPISPGTVDTSFNGVQDAFVFKLDSTGTVRLYGTFLGGSAATNAHAIAVDFAGSAVVGGVTSANDYPTTAGAISGSLSGTVDAFLTRLTPTAQDFVYSTYLGGTSVDSARAVVLDSAGHTYAAGQTTSSDFGPDAGYDSSYNGGGNDGFVVKLTSTADLSITMTDSPDPVRPRKALTYSIAVNNNGDDAVVDAVVVDTLPAGVSFNSATPSRGSCSVSSGVVTCQLGTIVPGDHATVAIVVTPQAGGTLVNQADVSSSTPDPAPSNNNAVVTTTVSGPASADLRLVMDDSPDPVAVGQNLTYSITINNVGPNPATNVVMTDALPGQVQVVSMTPSQGSCSPGISCSLGTINAGASATVQIVVQPTSPRKLRNTAAVSATERDPTASNNKDTETTVVNP